MHEAAQDALFRRFLRGYMDQEATPSLDPVPGVDLAAYKEDLIERFSNPEIRDTIARLVRKVPIGSQSGFCRWSATSFRRAAQSNSRRQSSRVGHATPKVWMSKAISSRSSTAVVTRSWHAQRVRRRTRQRSCRAQIFSAA